jgi:NitT/TauT family transport system ATP-binding protein
MIFVTHDISEAVYLADRVIVLGSRPGHVRADVAIDFPRPRELDLKRGAEFQEHVERISLLLERRAALWPSGRLRSRPSSRARSGATPTSCGAPGNAACAVSPGSSSSSPSGRRSSSCTS